VRDAPVRWTRSKPVILHPVSGLLRPRLGTSVKCVDGQHRARLRRLSKVVAVNTSGRKVSEPACSVGLLFFSYSNRRFCALLASRRGNVLGGTFRPNQLASFPGVH